MGHPKHGVIKVQGSWIFVEKGRTHNLPKCPGNSNSKVIGYCWMKETKFLAGRAFFSSSFCCLDIGF